MSGETFSTLPRHDLALVIGGVAYLGWTALRIERGLDSMVGSFDLELTAKEKTAAPDFPIASGDACQIVLGGTALITGYIDRVARRLDAEGRGISVSGRDRACDLVDCSALNQPGSWRAAKLDTIARELAAPFGVAIEITGDIGKPLARFALQQGETAWAAIERLARYRGLIAYSDGAGGVKLGNPDSGLRAGRIREGTNLLSIDADSDNSERFSRYVVKGQASGSDQHHGKAVAQIRGEAVDTAVTRARTLLLIGEEQSDAASLKLRAEWEAKVRAARAETITVDVPGWFGGDGAASGPVWQPGARAECLAPSVGISGERLIERVVLQRDDGGTRSTLTLVAPDAWAQLAEREERA